MKRFRLFLAGIVVMAAVSATQAAVVTDGFDFVENLVVGSQNYVQTYRCIITSSHNIEFHIYIILLYTENIIKSIGFQIIYRNKRKRFGI